MKSLEFRSQMLRSLRSLGLPLGIATVIGVSLGACSVSVGEGDGGFDFDGGSFPETSPPVTNNEAGPTTPPGNAVCNSCLFQGCSGQHSVCQGNAECLAIYQCATKAGCDQACVNGCFAAYPSGQNEYTALYTCDQERTCAACQTECSATSCPAPVDAGPPPADAPLDCSACTTARCGTEQAACGVGSDCDAYSSCVLVCADAECTAICGEAHRPGKAASETLAACTTAKCTAECGF